MPAYKMCEHTWAPSMCAFQNVDLLIIKSNIIVEFQTLFHDNFYLKR